MEQENVSAHPSDGSLAKAEIEPVYHSSSSGVADLYCLELVVEYQSLSSEVVSDV